MGEIPRASASRDPRPRYELVVVNGDAIHVHPLPDRGAVTLGRNDDCTISIKSRTVSGHHAVLHLGPPLRIEDLDSANGTILTDRTVHRATASTYRQRSLQGQAAELAVGDRVGLGATVIILVRHATAVRQGGGTGAAPPSPLADHGPVVRDPSMQRLYEDVRHAAKHTMSVLLLGETGVGKEVVAHAIHASSPRVAGPFVALNCAELNPNLAESELFGHEKGGYTGAVQSRPGLIESANGGTLFLDEVGDLPLPIQVKLLRVLEEHKVRPMGSNKVRTVDVRIVAATNRDLEADVERRSFRQDLLFRLNTMELTIPPLRERRTEIAPLAEHFLASACQRVERATALRIAPETLSFLECYRWPGNVRELRNVIDRAVALCDHDAILPEDLPARVILSGKTPPHIAADFESIAEAEPIAGSRGDARDQWKRATDEEKRRRLADALEKYAGNQTRAAAMLGISLRTVATWLEKFGFPRPRKQ